MFENKYKQHTTSIFLYNLSLKQQYMLYRFLISSNSIYIKKKKLYTVFYFFCVNTYSFYSRINPFIFLFFYFFVKTSNTLFVISPLKQDNINYDILSLLKNLNTCKIKNGVFISTKVSFLENVRNIYTQYNVLETLKSYNYIFLQSGLKSVVNNVVFFSKTFVTKPLYNTSSMCKYVNLTSINDFEFQFLRKNKVYNKGRYSRCRQNYRTGVYMCMYLSVISIFGLYYWFYKFSFNFTYLWWVFIIFVCSFFLPKFIKYRFYEPITILNSFFGFFCWLAFLIKSVFLK